LTVSQDFCKLLGDIKYYKLTYMIILDKSLLLPRAPSVDTLLFVGFVGLAWSYACLRFAGYLKCSRNLPTGYTRKFFHLLIFFTVAGLQLRWGVLAVCVFGAMTSVVLAYAVFRGAGHPLYEAIAREADRPHRTYYVVVPYFATLIGGIASNLLFGPLSLVGYLVGGIGDAAGEPVGTRWGKHQYKVSWLGRRAGTKSLEGSAAILVASLLGLLAAIVTNPQRHLSWQSVVAMIVIAVSCTLIEAASPRGWDNTPMQVVPTFLAFVLLPF
jgi:phytol kinase